MSTFRPALIIAALILCSSCERPVDQIVKEYDMAKRAGLPGSAQDACDAAREVKAIYSALCSKRTKAVTGVITRDAGATSCDAAPLKE